MKRATTIASKSTKKVMGRPRTVSDNGHASTIAVRFRPGIYAHIERMAAHAGRKKSDIVRELVDEAIAGRTADGMKMTRRK